MLVLQLLYSFYVLHVRHVEKTYQEVTGQKDNTEYSLCGNYFTLITEWDDSGAIYRIVYAKDTKVKYFIAKSGYKFGITPLYNADGTVQVYGE